MEVLDSSNGIECSGLFTGELKGLSYKAAEFSQKTRTELEFSKNFDSNSQFTKETFLHELRRMTTLKLFSVFKVLFAPDILSDLFRLLAQKINAVQQAKTKTRMRTHNQRTLNLYKIQTSLH